jgi:predicted ATP-grasp superfamily ATP-dependent carboligase
MQASGSLPPAIILGGEHNAFSIARSLGAAGITVHAINAPESELKYSRFCKLIDITGKFSRQQDAWADYLLGPQSEPLRDSVLLAACDEGIEIIAKHREALSHKFRLDISNVTAQLGMLNKLYTYETARAAGVPAPKFWRCDSRQEVEAVKKDELVFPLVLKPLFSHEFRRKFAAPLVIARNYDELLAAFDMAAESQIRMLLLEMIPGPDDRLCSYFTYLDEGGNNLFDFTKRVIRRYPVNMGGASYHITDHVPGIQELALRFLRHVGLRGVANIEFKLDERDGQMKLIECNARFTASDCLLTASGLDLPLFVYNRIVGRPAVAPVTYSVGLRLWKPIADFRSYRQLRKRGELTTLAWIQSLLHPWILPVFRWDDPLPALVSLARLGRIAISRLTGRKSCPKSQPQQAGHSRPAEVTISEAHDNVEYLSSR